MALVKSTLCDKELIEGRGTCPLLNLTTNVYDE
jgi:hypothetical protein